LADSQRISSADALCSQINDGEHIQPPYVADGLPMLTAKHVRNGFVDGSEAGLISPENFRKARKRCAREGVVAADGVGTLVWLGHFQR
jgi:hypothetical protein